LDPDHEKILWSKSPVCHISLSLSLSFTHSFTHFHSTHTHVHKVPVFAIVFYMLPQEPALAVRLWCALCTSLGLYDDTKTKKLPEALGNDPQSLILPLLLAVELGDDVVQSKIRPVLSLMVDGRFFDANVDNKSSKVNCDFGYFFFLSESWPRGQLSALLMCLEVLRPGSWQRVFHNACDRERFRAPRIVKTAWPDIGVLRAENLLGSRLIIHLRNISYDKDRTSVDIANIGGDMKDIRVNGTSWKHWERLDSGLVRVNVMLRKGAECEIEIHGTGWVMSRVDDDDGWKPISARDFLRRASAI